MKVFLCCVALVSACTLFGQTSQPVAEQTLPDSASTSKAAAEGASAFTAEPIRMAPPPLSIQSNPPVERRRVVDRHFLWVALFQVGATLADIESTQYGLSHGAREINPLYGNHPSRAKQYAITMPITAGVLGWSYRLKRSAPHSKYWVIPPLIVGTMHAIAFCNNLAVIKGQ